MKKQYIKPSVEMELQHKCQILAGSTDPYGINDELQNEEVIVGW